MNGPATTIHRPAISTHPRIIHHARRLLIAAAVGFIAVGSLAAQAFESRVAITSLTPARRAIPAHTCTPTFCAVKPPRPQLDGRWSDAVTPAVLLSAGLATLIAATRIR